jgi:uncharacterized protein (DUF2249 family)
MNEHANVVELDVREELRAGREPFQRIMATVDRLGADDVLLLRATFEPVPLLKVLAKRGLTHEVTRHGPDDFTVRFWRAVPEATTVVLDVRGLEPPEPLSRTLAAIEALSPGQALVQVNERVPRLLLPMLAERGFAHEVDESHGDRVLVRIWRS